MMKPMLAGLLAALMLCAVGCAPETLPQENSAEETEGTTGASATATVTVTTALPSADTSTTAAPVTTTATSAVATTTQAQPQPLYDIHQLDPAKQYMAVGGGIFDFKSSDPAHYILQGGYYDGEYFYVAHISKLDGGYEEARILVLDYWGNPVRESEPLPLDHANCITYNDRIDRLVVAHCQAPDGHYNRYSYVDPQMLTVTGTFDAPQPFFAIGYSKEKQRYASARWGGETLDFWDADMNHLFAVDVEMPGSLSQGVFCDETGVYFVRSSQNGFSAEIRVYDWEGHLMRIIPIEIDGNIEPESISIVNGETLVLGNNWNRWRSEAFILEYKLVG